MPILGVDFSGAADPSRKIWVTEAASKERRLQVVACRSIRDLDPDAGTQEAAYRCLRSQLQAPNVVAGLDFPFSLPDQLVTQRSWKAFVRGFSATYPSAEAFREQCRTAAGGRELRRATDRDARTPFAPYNLRMYRQTYHGITGVLAPLVKARQVSVLPMQPWDRQRGNLIEVCPASLLKSHNAYVSYKGRKPHNRDERHNLLTWLQTNGVEVPEAICEIATRDAEGDALDSILCAFVTWKSLPTLRETKVPGDQEGHVYNWLDDASAAGIAEEPLGQTVGAEQLLQLARQCCDTIAHHEDVSLPELVNRLAEQIAGLVAGTLSMARRVHRHSVVEPVEPSDHELCTKVEAYRAIYGSLGRKFGRYNLHQRVLFPYSDDSNASEATLADDLADLAGDLGSALAHPSPTQQLAYLVHSFEIHWRYHATGALHALIAVRDELKLDD